MLVTQRDDSHTVLRRENAVLRAPCAASQTRAVFPCVNANSVVWHERGAVSAGSLNGEACDFVRDALELFDDEHGRAGLSVTGASD